jgi:hypothetical protein
MSTTGRSGTVHPDACPAFTSTVGTMTVTQPNLMCNWTFTGPTLSGANVWVWALHSDGTLGYSPGHGLSSGAPVGIFSGWNTGNTGSGWFECRSASGELLGKSAVISITG